MLRVIVGMNRVVQKSPVSHKFHKGVLCTRRYTTPLVSLTLSWFCSRRHSVCSHDVWPAHDCQQARAGLQSHFSVNEMLKENSWPAPRQLQDILRKSQHDSNFLKDTSSLFYITGKRIIDSCSLSL